ncbi:MAG TPA: hypothetical protein VL422_11690, partial [Miltoncostaea sp.]|nr:hypothetical protein [Miltoncostaea sp.]
LVALFLGSPVVLLPLLWGMWRLARRWPDMQIPLVFALGLLGVLVGAGEVILQMEEYHVGSRSAAIGVLVAMLLAIVALLRWALRRMSTREAAAGAPETREKETATTGTSEK